VIAMGMIKKKLMVHLAVYCIRNKDHNNGKLQLEHSSIPLLTYSAYGSILLFKQNNPLFIKISTIFKNILHFELITGGCLKRVSVYPVTSCV
jgi:hypothetical protein